MVSLGIESVLVAGRGPAACAVVSACARLGVKSVAVHSEAERTARHVRLADDAVLLGPAPAAESYLAVDRIVEAAARSGVTAVLPVPPALAGNARLAAAVTKAGLTWVGPDAEVLERLGGDGVEPASERGFLAWVTADGLRFTTPVSRDRAAGIARVSWTPDGPSELPARARRLADIGWRGLVTVGLDPDGELAEIAAGFSLDMAVLERAHGVDAVELALRSASRPAAAGPEPVAGFPRSAVAVQLRSTLPPGQAGRVTGRLPGVGPRAAAASRAPTSSPSPATSRATGSTAGTTRCWRRSASEPRTARRRRGSPPTCSPDCPRRVSRTTATRSARCSAGCRGAPSPARDHLLG